MKFVFNQELVKEKVEHITTSGYQMGIIKDAVIESSDRNSGKSMVFTLDVDGIEVKYLRIFLLRAKDGTEIAEGMRLMNSILAITRVQSVESVKVGADERLVGIEGKRIGVMLQKEEYVKSSDNTIKYKMVPIEFYFPETKQTPYEMMSKLEATDYKNVPADILVDKDLPSHPMNSVPTAPLFQASGMAGAPAFIPQAKPKAVAPVVDDNAALDALFGVK